MYRVNTATEKRSAYWNAQVLQKQAKQEQEKQRKLQEQHEELQLMERERAAATRRPQAQQDAAIDPPQPAPMPQRPVAMPQTTAEALQGPDGSGHFFGQISEGLIPDTASVAAVQRGDSYVAAAFSPPPSIFESLLREPGIGARSTAFYDDLAALQRLSAELDTAAKQRRAKLQTNYAKPNFLHQEIRPVSADALHSAESLPSPVKLHDDKLVGTCIDSPTKINARGSRAISDFTFANPPSKTETRSAAHHPEDTEDQYVLLLYWRC